jgi:hypothetical protein
MKKFVLPLIALAATSPAFAVVMIDNFDTGAYSAATDVTGTLFTDVKAATVLGGSRTVTHITNANPEQTFYTIKVGNPATGTLTVGNGDGLVSRTETSYGLAGALNFNAAAGGNTAFRISVRSNEKPLNYTIRINSSAFGGFAPDVTGTIAAGTNFNQDIAFTNWSPVVIGDVDSITFRFESQPAGDFTLDSVSAVPEPASLIALGAGLAALARRKRAAR